MKIKPSVNAPTGANILCRQIGIWAAIFSFVFVTICLAGAPDDARSHSNSHIKYSNYISIKTTQPGPVAPEAAHFFDDNLFSCSTTICQDDTAVADRRLKFPAGSDNYSPSSPIFESSGSSWDFLSTKELSLGVNLSISLPLTTSPCVKTEAPKNSSISGIINFSYTSTQIKDKRFSDDNRNNVGATPIYSPEVDKLPATDPATSDPTTTAGPSRPFFTKPVTPQQWPVLAPTNETELPQAHPIAGPLPVLDHPAGRHPLLALGVGHSPLAHPFGRHPPHARTPPASASNRQPGGTPPRSAPPSAGTPDSAMAVPSEPSLPPRPPAAPHAHAGGAEGRPLLPAAAHAAPPTAALSSAPQPPQQPGRRPP